MKLTDCEKKIYELYENGDYEGVVGVRLSSGNINLNTMVEFGVMIASKGRKDLALELADKIGGYHGEVLLEKIQ